MEGLCNASVKRGPFTLFSLALGLESIKKVSVSRHVHPTKSEGRSWWKCQTQEGGAERDVITGRQLFFGQSSRSACVGSCFSLILRQKNACERWQDKICLFLQHRGLFSAPSLSELFCTDKTSCSWQHLVLGLVFISCHKKSVQIWHLDFGFDDFYSSAQMPTDHPWTKEDMIILNFFSLNVDFINLLLTNYCDV